MQWVCFVSQHEHHALGTSSALQRFYDHAAQSLRSIPLESGCVGIACAVDNQNIPQSVEDQLKIDRKVHRKVQLQFAVEPTKIFALLIV